MSIKPIGKRNVGDEVLEQMKTQIISGEWASGAKIPGENELARLFEVSRVSVRDALKRLSGMGVLHTKRGEGTYVTEILPKDYLDILLPVLMIERDSLMDVLEFRAGMEVQSAALAAIRARDEDIMMLEDIIERMKGNLGSNIEFARQDLNFHTAIAVSTHNPVILKINSIIHQMLGSAMEKVIEITGYEPGIRYHTSILEAIKKKDSEKAAKIMSEHIDVTIKAIRKEGADGIIIK